MRALLSVYDKTGLAELARGLVDLGWELVASGGTAEALAKAGLPHLTVEEVTGLAPMLGHRVVTLHPSIHGGILADRSDPRHLADLDAAGIEGIDLVVCNLYPFRERPGIDTIDVGGVAMVRAAAKNHASVGVVVDPAEYGGVLAELQADGALSAPTRRRLARTAFACTAAVDAAIVAFFDAGGAGGEPELFPPTLHLSLERAASLRYGENPHQLAARYRSAGDQGFWDEVVQHAGLALSYLNLLDTEAAWRLVHELGRDGAKAAAAIIKHASPCGAAVAASPLVACRLAQQADPLSAFGGIVALNLRMTEELAVQLSAGPQADVVVAPGYEPGAVGVLQARRRNTRVLEAPPPDRPALSYRQVGGGFLVQEVDRFVARREDWTVATRTAPTAAQWDDLELAWQVCAYTTSNAVVLAAGGQAVGVGAGQQSRVESAEIATRKAAGRAKGGVAASDGLFPFRDGLDAVAAAGVAAVVQPGGSVNDREVVAAADEHGIAMVLTGERHFRQ
jgi:phosphoribosylaminoimidazolecarboxamide formyltransferase / IMP cyclohydrolase